MDRMFGDPNEFAIQAGLDTDGSLSSVLWGHSCLWCRGVPIGNINKLFCGIGFGDRLQKWLEPVAGQPVIAGLWADEFEGLSARDLWNFLDERLYGCRDDEIIETDQPYDEMVEQAERWRRFDFATTWGEPFDGHKSFIMRPPGGAVRILARLPPRREISVFDVSLDLFLTASRDFIAWYDAMQRQRDLEIEAAGSQRPPADEQPWFPPEAVAHLQSAGYRADAFACLETVCNSLFWSDEAYMEFMAVCHSLGSPWFREPIRFRSSLIRGEPDEAARGAWEELRRLCPEWPGFRPERRSESLRGDLARLSGTRV